MNLTINIRRTRDAGWDESKHKRDHGKFATGASNSSERPRNPAIHPEPGDRQALITHHQKHAISHANRHFMDKLKKGRGDLSSDELKQHHQIEHARHRAMANHHEGLASQDWHPANKAHNQKRAKIHSSLEAHHKRFI